MDKPVIAAARIGEDTLHCHWHLDGEFFAQFEGTEILDADIEVEAEITDSWSVCVSCDIRGTVKVLCDRCMGELTLPVETSFEEEDYEVGAQLDLSQDIYDYVCTSLPLHKVHPDGECDPEVVRHLGVN